MLQHEAVLLEQRKQKCGPSVEMGEFWVGAGRIERSASCESKLIDCISVS